MVRALSMLLLAASLAGCEVAPPDSADRTQCAAAWELPPGTVRATLTDVGLYLARDGRYSTHEGISVIADSGEFSLTLSAIRDVQGNDVLGLADTGQFPISATLGSNADADGYALVYRGSGAWVTDRSANGWMTLAGIDDDELVGCFSVGVASLEDGRELTWTDGALHVPRL
jgi:hypothetical protein